MYLNRNSGFTYTIREDLMPSELEIIVVEIKKPKVKPLVVISWYRIPDSGIGLFDNIESIFQQIECEYKEVCLLGDVNCDLLTENPTCYTVKMCEIAVKYNHFIVYSILGKERKSVKHRHKYSVGRQYKNLDVNQFKSDLQNVDWRNVKKTQRH